MVLGGIKHMNTPNITFRPERLFSKPNLVPPSDQYCIYTSTHTHITTVVGWTRHSLKIPSQIWWQKIITRSNDSSKVGIVEKTGIIVFEVSKICTPSRGRGETRKVCLMLQRDKMSVKHGLFECVHASMRFGTSNGRGPNVSWTAVKQIKLKRRSNSFQVCSLRQTLCSVILCFHKSSSFLTVASPESTFAIQGSTRRTDL